MKELLRGIIPPIGIFDSGVGGLTVAAEVMNTLPAEDIIYISYCLMSDEEAKNYQPKVITVDADNKLPA